MRSQKIIFLFFLIILACSSDKVDPIPSEFSTYTERFITEAKARGIDMNLSSLTVQFVDPSVMPNYCGYGYITPRIDISNSDICWHNRTDIQKELLLFHELGHAILRRAHLNDTLPNGDFRSLMSEGDLYSTYGPYTPEKRKYYIDELFNPSTPAPDWALPKTTSVEILNDSINRLTNAWSFTRGTGTDQTGKLDNKVFISSGHSLSIHSTASVPNTSSYWRYSVSPSGIPVGAQLVLKVKIKVTDVTETGVYLSMRTDLPDETSAFSTTLGKITITGTNGFKEYSLTLPYFPEQAKSTSVFLFLDGSSTGSVHFDDISMSYRK